MLKMDPISLKLLLLVIICFIGVHSQRNPCPTSNGQTNDCECETAVRGTLMYCDNTELEQIPYIPYDTVELSMTKTRLKSIVNETFITLTRLERLSFDTCVIENVEPLAFTNLTSLQTLTIKNNWLKMLPDRVFINLTSLTELDLSSNSILSLTAENFAGLGKLNRLNVANNRITDLQDDVFKHLIGVKYLDLSSNKLTMLPETIFYYNSQLLQFRANDNQITHLYQRIFNSTAGIEDIEINENPLMYMDSDTFTNLTNLNTLLINNAQFICDCHLTPYKTWLMQWTSERSVESSTLGSCSAPEEYRSQYINDLDLSAFICTTTTSTTTTTTTPTTTPARTQPAHGNTTPLDKTEMGIIIGCTVGGALVLIIILVLACYCMKRKASRTKDVKYIVKPTNNGVNPYQSKFDDNSLTKSDSSVGVISPYTPDSVRGIIHQDEYSGQYKPNIYHNETDLDGDLQDQMSAWDDYRHQYNIPPKDPTNEMLFYNSLPKNPSNLQVHSGRQSVPISRSYHTPPTSIHGSTIHRATPIRPFDVRSPHYNPPTPWREQYSSNGVLPTDSYYNNYQYRALQNEHYARDYETEHGKYSTGSADSGVHSGSPARHTPTELSDSQTSPNAQTVMANNQIKASSLSLEQKIKNETYV